MIAEPLLSRRDTPMTDARLGTTLFLMGAVLASVGALAHALADSPAAQIPAVVAREETPAPKDEEPRLDADGSPLPPGAIARLGTLRFRSGDFLQGICLMPDGKTLATVAW